jgi:DNA-binding MarR family transcriptional regulator
MTTENADFNANLAEMQDTCVCYNIRKAARLVTQFYDATLEPSGLLGTQFVLMAVIGRVGAAPITRLGKAMGMDRTTVTRNLRPLERQGFIEMDAGLDRRTHIVRLTEGGRQALKAALPLWQQAQAAVTSQFGQDRTAALLTELQALEIRMESI